METPPGDLVLRDILLRQIRKCQLMKYDIEAFDRVPESQSRSPMHSYCKTSEIFWTEKDSDQIGTGLLKRTNRLKSFSLLHPLRGERIVEKEKEIEVDPAIEATARKGIRYVPSFGMVNVRKEGTVPTNMSRIPQDLGPRKRRVRAKAVVEVLPHQENQRKRWLRSLARTSNRANVLVVTNVFTNMKTQLHPQRIPNEQIALHQRRRPAQKLRKASPKGMLVLQREKICQRPQKP